MISEVFNIDCMVGMKDYPDKYFDLAVVDPPYGIKQDLKQSKVAGLKGHHKTSGKYKEYHSTNWDSVTPGKNYFDELIRVSKKQIVWGGNYFSDLNFAGVIIWDKGESIYDNDGELAKTSFGGFRIFRMSRADAYINKCDIKIHPTQKPTELYDWTYSKFLPNGGKVIDTHLGSGSNRIAADKAGNIDFTGFELDKDYYEAQEKRWKNYKAQLKIEF